MLALVMFGHMPTHARWANVLSDAAHGAERRAVHARIRDDSRWAIAASEPQADWRPFRRIAIDPANPTDEVLRLQIRVRDSGASHRPRESSAWTIVAAPHARPSWSAPPPPHDLGAPDLSVIQAVILNRYRGNGADEFYVMRMWLE